MSFSQPTIYVLTAKHGATNKAFFRFFVVDEDVVIVDITSKVHYVADYPIRDCKQYFAIYTHCTNSQDIVQEVSRRVFDGQFTGKVDTHNVIRMEKL